MFKKYNRAKYMKHNHAMVNLWTKKVVVIKTVPPNDSNSVPNELVSKFILLIFNFNLLK